MRTKVDGSSKDDVCEIEKEKKDCMLQHKEISRMDVKDRLKGKWGKGHTMEEPVTV